MEKNIKDYLHLYIGCEVENFPYKKHEGVEVAPKRMVGLLVGIVGENAHIKNKDVFGKDWDIIKEKISDVKPLLRPLSSMTEDEMKVLWKIVFKRDFVGDNIIYIKARTTLTEPRWVLSSGVSRLGIQLNGEIWYDCDLQTYKFNQHELTLWLLSKHFDLFNLIESGLAVEMNAECTSE